MIAPRQWSAWLIVWTGALCSLGKCALAQTPLDNIRVSPIRLGEPRGAEPIQPVAAKTEAPSPPPAQIKPSGKIEDSAEFFAKIMQLTPPAAGRLFQMESEDALRARWQKEARANKWPLEIEFPDSKAKGPEPEPARARPLLSLVVEPHYLCTPPLWFEQLHAERFGFDLRGLQPFVSAGRFYTDLAILPLQWAPPPLRLFECHRDVSIGDGSILEPRR